MLNSPASPPGGKAIKQQSRVPSAMKLNGGKGSPSPPTQLASKSLIQRFNGQKKSFKAPVRVAARSNLNSRFDQVATPKPAAAK